MNPREPFRQELFSVCPALDFVINEKHFRMEVLLSYQLSASESSGLIRFMNKPNCGTVKSISA